MSEPCNNQTLSDLAYEKNHSAKREIRFCKNSVEKHPMDQFYKMQGEYKEFTNVEQFVLCTSGEENKPSVRTTVLTKTDRNNTSFHFFALTTSRKARELEENNNASAIFLWGIQGSYCQIRIEGKVIRLSESETLKDYTKLSDDFKAYYHITQRGQVIESVESLKGKHEKFLGIVHELPCPFHVFTRRSFALEAEVIEFCKPEGIFENDRVLYRKKVEEEDINEIFTVKGEGHWLIENICP